MKVSSIMTKRPHVLSSNETIKKAAKKMKKLDCGVIPISNGEKLVGMVTDRDITLRAVAEGKDPETTKLKDIMSHEVWYCFEDDDVEDAAKSMQNKQVKRLIVLNSNKRLTGIIALGDISYKTENTQLSGKIIQEISENRN